jgi:hypothetical protein
MPLVVPGIHVACLWPVALLELHLRGCSANFSTDQQHFEACITFDHIPYRLAVDRRNPPSMDKLIISLGEI